MEPAKRQPTDRAATRRPAAVTDREQTAPDTGVGSARTGPSTAEPLRAAGSLLSLQGLAGNRAVRRMVTGQRGSAPGMVVQRRRVPIGAQTDPLVAGGATDRLRHLGGLERVNARALTQMTPADRTAVMTLAHTSAGSAAAFNALPGPDRARLVADAIRTFRPGLILGDPALMNIGPRPATPDTANITTLVTNATTLINIVIGGARDADLRDVFGAAAVATAKARYTAARDRMTYLHSHDKIVTDRSGYNAQVGLGGLTNASQIALAPQVIDNPAVDENVVMMIHESMHAGNPGVVGDEGGYRRSTGFTTRDSTEKLDNAAHYEIVPRRVRALADSYPGVVFVPAGTSVTIGGVTHTSAPLTPIEQASKDAYKKLRVAWGVGLNLHNLWVRINRNRGEWSTLDVAATFAGATAAHFADCMPFWSKVEGLTVHQRPGLSPGSPDPSKAPVTQIDLALSEGLVRLLSLAKNLATAKFATAYETTIFLGAHTTAAERAAATTVPLKSTLLLTAIRRALGQFVGAEDRDVRIIQTMAASPTYTLMLAPRPPSAFP
jgi:hypothetical protein